MTTGGYDPNQDPQNPQQGSYPPPGGNYPPPQQGGYPPPQQGGYGQPAGYPAAPQFDNTGVAPQLSVGAALSYGWNKFKQNPGVWAGILIIAVIIQGILNFIFRDPGNTFVSLIGLIIVTVVGYLIQAALVRGALHETDGNKPRFGSFFQFSNVGAIVIAGIVIGLVAGIGYVLLIIPGLLVTFFTWWTFQFIIDHNESAITAIKSSAKAIASNGGTIFLLALALVGINIVGALVFIVGLLVSVPVTIVASSYAYRVVTGGRVA